MKSSADIAGAKFDVAIAGAGIAGLALASALAESSLALNVLVVDDAPESPDDRTLSYFSARPLPIDVLARRVFHAIIFAAGGRKHALPLREYRYASLGGLTYRNAARGRVAENPRVTVVAGHVERAEADENEARLWVSGQSVRAKWIFDSRFEAARPAIARQDSLVQRFVGWEVEFEAPTLETDAARLFDFDDTEALRFHYVLPFSERVALFELVTFGAPAREADLAAYVAKQHPAVPYRIVRREGGESLLTAAPFARRLGPRIVAIGLAGGLLRASTGYALTRILADTRTIVDALEAGRHPLAFVRSSRLYRFFDGVFLHLAATHARVIPIAFAALFTRNPVDRVLRFLDERASFSDLVRLVASLPKRPFIRAFFGWLAVRIGLRRPFRDWPHPRPRKVIAP